MRYIIYGAGAVGGTIGGRLAMSGKDVVLICRGAHYEAVKANGLLFQGPEGDTRLHLPVVSHPKELTFTPDDVVILTVKTQQTEVALNDLEAAAGTDVRIVCAQNGVENERLASRRFKNVYGMLVNLPARHLVPGEIMSSGTPQSGVLHAGVYPTGVDDTITQVCADVSASNFVSEADPAVMRIKYAKLIQNLTNASDVVIGRAAADSPAGQEIATKMRDEGRRVLAAAGIDVAPPAEVAERVQKYYNSKPVKGQPHDATSTMQSVMRGFTTTEVDYLNGEIVLLGRLHGVPTPVNAVLRRLATEFAAKGLGQISIEKLNQVLESEQ